MKQHQIRWLTLLISFSTSISLFSCSNSTPSSNTSPNATASLTSSSQSNSANGNDPYTALLQGNNRQGTDPLELLQTPQIKQELSLTDSQSAQIKQIDQDFRTQLHQKASGVKLEGLSDQEKEAKLKEVKQEFDQLSQETRRKVGSVLKPEQATRLKQIFLQIYGWGVLTKDDFSSDLSLTTDQQQKLNDLSSEMYKKIKTNWEAPNSKDPQQRNKVLAGDRQRIEQIIKDSNQQAVALLKPEQQKTLETLKGKKFELDPKQLPSPN